MDAHESVKFAAGSNNNVCLLRAGGRVECVGENDDGELGNGSNVAARDWLVFGEIEDAVDVGCSTAMTCVVRMNGRVACAGGRASRETAISELPGLDDAVRVGSSGQLPCFVRRNGKISCVHPNFWKSVPMQGVADAVAMTNANDHTCILHAKGEVSCFGKNDSGQLGDGTQADRTQPTRVPDLDRVVDIAAGIGVTCARNVSDEILCWGKLGRFSSPREPMPYGRTSQSNWIAMGAAQLCLLNGTEPPSCNVPAAENSLVHGLPPVRFMAGSERRMCALSQTEEPWCWVLTKQPAPLIAAQPLGPQVPLPGKCVDPAMDAVQRDLDAARNGAKGLGRPWSQTPDDVRYALRGMTSKSTFDFDDDRILDLDVHASSNGSALHHLYVMRKGCGHWVGSFLGTNVDHLEGPKQKGLLTVFIENAERLACKSGTEKLVFDGKRYRSVAKRDPLPCAAAP